MIKKISSKSERFDSLVPGFHDDTDIRRNRPEFREIKEESPKVKIQHFEDLSNGFTPRLHLLKADYPMNDESTLCDAGGFFYG